MMNKKILVAAMVATMACVSMVGCGMNNNEPRKIQLAPGVTTEVTGNAGGFTMEGDSSFGEIDLGDPASVTPASLRTYMAQPAAPVVKEVKAAAQKDLVVLNNDACKVVLKSVKDGGKSEYSESSKCYDVTYEITNKLDKDVICFSTQEVLGAGQTMTVTDHYDTWYMKNTDIKAYSLLERVAGEDNEKVILTQGFGEMNESGVKVAFNFAIPVNVNTMAYAVAV